MFELRNFSVDDFISLATLSDDEWKSAHQNIASAMMKVDTTIEKCIVATVDGIIVGYIYGFSLPNGTLIPEFLYVVPKYRKKGVGKHLLGELERHSGCTTSMIFYHKSLHEYYEKLGYSTGSNLETAMKDIYPQNTKVNGNV